MNEITVGPYGFRKANGHWYPNSETLHANWQEVICEIAATLLDEIAEVRSLLKAQCLQSELELQADHPTCEEDDCVEARQVP